jgi:hypothetical protein
MKRLALFFLLVATTAAFAQAPVRVRGTITALSGDVLSVKSRDGKDLKIQLAPDLGVSTAKSTTLAELKDKYVGVTAMNKDGKLVAVEVHALPPQAPPGHTPWDLQPGSTMTNANLEGIAQASGGTEITMNYKGGSQKILVPPGTPIVAFVPGSRADLKPGEYIWTSARQEADGKLLAQRISVSKDGVKPPH